MMAKDKEKKRAKSSGVTAVDERYVCNECHSEIPVHQDCPTCKKHIDWDRVFMEVRR
jgi:hypothetical protein